MFEYLSVFIRLFIGFLFLSTAIHKINNFSAHILVLNNYKIIHSKHTKTVAFLDTVIETCAAILLLVGLFIRLATVIIVILLIAYSIGIVINLLRGRTEISCGCGGLAGSHNISWMIPIRNICLIIACILMLKYNSIFGSVDGFLLTKNICVLFNTELLVIFFTVIIVSLFLYAENEIYELQKRFKKLYIES